MAQSVSRHAAHADNPVARAGQADVTPVEQTPGASGTVKRVFSIRSQLMLIIFTSAVLVLSVATFAFSYIEVRDERGKAVDETRMAATIIAQQFVRAIVLDTPDAVAEMSLTLESLPHIHNAVLFDSTGSPLLAYNRDPNDRIDPPLRPAPSLTTDAHYINIYQPIVYQGKHYGTAYFRVTHTELKQALQGYVREVSVLLPALLLLSFLLAVYFQRFVTLPVSTLARAVKHVAHTGDYSLRVHARGSREIRSLFDGFNTLLGREHQARQMLHAEKTRLHVTLESIADGVITTDRQCTVTYMNPVAEQLTGWTQAEAMGRPLDEVYVLHDESSGQILCGETDMCLVQGTVRFNEDHIVLHPRHGGKLAVQSSTAPMRDENGDINGAVVVFHNVAEAREMARKLHHQATHDVLTGLVNRAEFEHRLGVLHAAQTDHALLFIDLDRFKIVNDTAGHIAGDALLKQVALLLRDCVRKSDIVARLGGDEFAILLDKCNREQALGIAEKIRTAIEHFVFGWEDRTFKIGTSIGLVHNHERLYTYAELMRAGDIACYAAKDMGRNRIHLYTEDDAELTRRHGEVEWVARINDALDNDRFVLHVQRIEPFLAHRHRVHYEVLLRMRGEDGQLHPPGMFIPAAERYGLMPKLDLWVLNHVFNNENVLRCLAVENRITLNINLSGTTLNDDKYIQHIHALYKQHGLPPKAICFEITETAAIANLAATAKFMRDLKQRGCQFALDDFGSGVSSFAYLSNLPVDHVKIDGGFVRDMAENPVHRAMVHAINEIGHVMGLKTVAEFVENSRIHSLLYGMGVDYAQGYYLHRPEPLDTVCQTLWLTAGLTPKHTRAGHTAQ